MSAANLLTSARSNSFAWRQDLPDVPGKAVDAAIGVLLAELVTPMNLEVTLAVQRELESAREVDAMRAACRTNRYEANWRARYMNVDPDNARRQFTRS